MVIAEGRLLKPDGDSENGLWVIYIAPAVYNEYCADKRSRNESVPLDINSLQRELSKEPYFIPLPRVAPRSHRKRIDGVSYCGCWVAALEDKCGRKPFLYLEQIVPLVAEEADLQCLIRLGIISNDMEPEQNLE